MGYLTSLVIIALLRIVFFSIACGNFSIQLAGISAWSAKFSMDRRRIFEPETK
jgi:hypothetical protein